MDGLCINAEKTTIIREFESNRLIQHTMCSVGQMATAVEVDETLLW